MKRVLIESPYGSPDESVIAENVRYARACLADSLRRGEAPYASHLLYTQPGVLRDELSSERALGIEAGLTWGSCAELTAVYMDRGITSGMRQGVERAEAEGRAVEYRTVFGWAP